MALLAARLYYCSLLEQSMVSYIAGGVAVCPSNINISASHINVLLVNLPSKLTHRTHLIYLVSICPKMYFSTTSLVLVLLAAAPLIQAQSSASSSASGTSTAVRSHTGSSTTASSAKSTAKSSSSATQTSTRATGAATMPTVGMDTLLLGVAAAVVGAF